MVPNAHWRVALSQQRDPFILLASLYLLAYDDGMRLTPSALGTESRRRPFVFKLTHGLLPTRVHRA